MWQHRKQKVTFKVTSKQKNIRFSFQGFLPLVVPELPKLFLFGSTPGHSMVVFGVSNRVVISIKTTLNSLYSISVSFWRFLYLCSLYSRAIIMFIALSSIAHISPFSVVPQLSKCLKFMTFQEGCFVICN